MSVRRSLLGEVLPDLCTATPVRELLEVFGVLGRFLVVFSPSLGHILSF
jgi:hypothetical protein